MDADRQLAWRVQMARRISRPYEEGSQLSAMAVAGSVAVGVADRWSDLELACYWHTPPSKSQRLEGI